MAKKIWYKFKVFNSDNEHVYNLQVSELGKEFKIQESMDLLWSKGKIDNSTFLLKSGKIGITQALINQPQHLDSFELIANSGNKYKCVADGQITALSNERLVAGRSLLRI